MSRSTNKEDSFLIEVQKLIQQGNVDKAAEMLRYVKQDDSSSAYALYLLGCLHFLKQDFELALQSFELALSKNPSDYTVHNNHGVVLEKLGRDKEAAAAYREAIRLKNNYVEAFCNLGSLLERLGIYQEAIGYLTQAVGIQPNNGKAYNLLGLCCERLRRFGDAISHYRQALAIQPTMLDAANNLGNLLSSQGKLTESRTILEQALAANPQKNAILLNNIGQTYLLEGRADKALDFYQQAQAANQEEIASIESNFLLTLNYLPLRAEDIFSAHKKWGEKFSYIPSAASFPNEKRLHRRLRIGYVSPDFYSHSVMYFFEAVLSQHDCSKFEIFLYNAHPYYFDETTEKLRNMVSGWRNIAQLPDAQAYEEIRKDKIDILVDLTGHAAKNRLGVFALKPAPVQVTWIGYPNTTGLTQMDYRFTDKFADPAGQTDSLHVEKLIRLPQTFLCYQPRTDIAEPGVLPAKDNDYITFGSFNNLAKVSPYLIALWSRILQAVPNAKLLMKARGLGDDGVRQYFLSLFADNGVSSQQLIFEERCGNIKEHFDYYNKIDIALDTFPYHGTTTTCDALWMGVPVVCLAGKSHVSRVGVSLLHNAGLPELIADSQDEYITIAVNLAYDTAKLASLRQNLRARLQASPLLDGKMMAQNIENEYQTMWKKWLTDNQFDVGTDLGEVSLFGNEEGHAAVSIAVLYERATAFKNNQQWQEAAEVYQQVVTLAPEHTEAHAALGAVLHMVGRREEAIDHYQKAVVLNPCNYALLHNFAVCLREAGKVAEALGLLYKAIEIKPDYTLAYNQLLLIEREQGNWDKVINLSEKILTFEANHLEALKTLGVVYKGRRQRGKAEKYLKQALAVDPNSVEVLNTLGNLYTDAGHIAEATAAYQQALELNPNEAITYCNLASCLAKQGKSTETVECFRKALQLNPNLSKLHSNILLALAYLDNIDPGIIYEEHKQWAQNHAAKLYPAAGDIPRRLMSPTMRRLRIGYISPDFRSHSVAFFIEPILKLHDHSKFEIVIYCDVKFPDETTARILANADRWHDISQMNDIQVYELICKDKIDILVDLAGHTADNRMLVFARKPAPLQITWLGYPNTTGLATMDYRLTDHYADPIGITDQFHSEKLIRLADTFLCYQPNPDSPEVNALPYLTAGYITFGSFNNFNKVSPQTITMWSRILHRVPESRLLLKAGGFADAVTQQNVLEVFAKQGIASERILMQGQVPAYREHLASYYRMDIALDTFPYHGTTTTCEALWMGVPVVTLAGRTHVARVGVSLLSNVGLPECIMVSDDDYVEAAVTMATDIERLQAIRQQLRSQMEASPLMQANQFVGRLQDIYSKVWAEYQQRGSLAGLTAAQADEPIQKLVEQANQEFVRGNLDKAQLFYEKVLRLDLHNAVALHGLGLLVSQKGELEHGIVLLRQAVSETPTYFPAVYNLALLYEQCNNMQLAAEFFSKAYGLNQQHLGVNVNLARVCKMLKQLDKAVTFYQQAVKISAENPDIISELGDLLSQCGQCMQAIAVLNKGLEANPQHVGMLQGLGFAYKISGNAAEALCYYRKVIQIDPSLSECHSNVVSTLNCLSEYQPEQIVKEHKDWAACYTKNIVPYGVYKTEKLVNKRLKIGYVSADFREHSVAYFFEPVLKNHDHSQFEIYLYNNSRIFDETSRRLQAAAAGWINIYDLDDEQTAKLIWESGIDILVDLSGHTAGNRLLVFARKPAPVQVTWLGYPNTTGLTAMDYRLTDGYADPIGETDGFYTEKLLRMPTTFLCYLPQVATEQVNTPENVSKEKITFGSFTNLSKIIPQVIYVWSQILQRVPDSCLLLKSIGLADQAVQSHVKELFGKLGVTPERINLYGQTADYDTHLAMYKYLDIALDTFPYNGTTTTCEALFMGVPVIVLTGNSHVSRVGVSLLTNAGLPQLVVKDENEYIQTAVTLASERERLTRLRGQLQSTMRKSPLADAQTFTRELERKFRNIWEKWVDDNK